MPTNLPKKAKCPKCKEHSGLELVYNAPTEDDIPKLRKGLAIPGGFRPKGGPVYKWNCENCGHVRGNMDK